MTRPLRSWEDHLFHTHSLIPISPTQRLRCLDVHHKVARAGILWNSKDVISPIGSMTTLADVNVEGWTEQARGIDAGLRFLDGGQRAADVDIEAFVSDASEGMNIKEEIKSKQSFLKLILGVEGMGANAEFTNAESLTCEVVGLTSDRVATGYLAFLLNDALWKPDIRKLELQWPARGNKSLWIVTEVFYCTKLVIGRTRNAGGSAGLGTTAGSPIPLGDMALSASRDMEGIWEYSKTSGSRFPFAYRATKLTYNTGGELQVLDAHQRPITLQRGAEEEAEEGWLDPSGKNKEYHMLDLFEKAAVSKDAILSEEHEEAELVRLPFVSGSEADELVGENPAPLTS